MRRTTWVVVRVQYTMDGGTRRTRQHSKTMRHKDRTGKDEARQDETKTCEKRQKETRRKNKGNKSKRPAECMPTSMQAHSSYRPIHQCRQRVRHSDASMSSCPTVTFLEISIISATGRVASRVCVLLAIFRGAPRGLKMTLSLPLFEASLRSTQRGDGRTRTMSISQRT